MKVPNEPGVSPNNGLGNTGNIDKGHKDIAAAAVAAVYGGKYLECNLKIDSSANLPSDHVLIALDQMRQAMKSEEWGWDHAFHTEDFRTGTLILTGIAGKGSGGHVDWSQAQNIAFSFTQASSVFLFFFFFFFFFVGFFFFFLWGLGGFCLGWFGGVV